MLLSFQSFQVEAGELVHKLHSQSSFYFRLCLFEMSGVGWKEDLGEVKAHHPLALPNQSQSQRPGMLELTLTIQQGRQAGRGSTERDLSSYRVIT